MDLFFTCDHEWGKLYVKLGNSLSSCSRCETIIRIHAGYLTYQLPEERNADRWHPVPANYVLNMPPGQSYFKHVPSQATLEMQKEYVGWAKTYIQQYFSTACLFYVEELYAEGELYCVGLSFEQSNVSGRFSKLVKLNYSQAIGMFKADYSSTNEV